MAIDVFSHEQLSEIIKVSASDNTHVITRESSRIEFKESFGWKSLSVYLRTMSAFANAKGGYIVFGVKNNPREIVGLKGKNLENFESIDLERITEFLSEHFDQEISYEIQVAEYNAKRLGLIWVAESTTKPVICKKNHSNQELKEGEIYYRYRGRSQKIRYAELNAILVERRDSEQKKWMRLFQKIAKAGIDNAGVIDFSTGEISEGKKTIVLDKDLASRLNFIKSGEFSESKGKPTLRVIGEAVEIDNLTPLPGRPRIIKIRGYETEDIILNFLRERNVEEPEAVLRALCSQSSAFMPIYYYVRMAKLSNNESIEILKKIVSRGGVRDRLITRIDKDDSQFVGLPRSETPSSREKQEFIEKICRKRVSQTLSESEVKRCMQSIRAMDDDEIHSNKKYLCKVIERNFLKFFESTDSNLVDALRRAICRVDEALYKNSD
jgi:hypothetical protein